MESYLKHSKTADALDTYKVIETINGRVSNWEFWDNGIIYIKLNDQMTVELEDTIRQNESLKERYDGKNKFRILIEAGRYTDISKDSREFSSKPENNTMTLATAVVIKSLAHRIIINFMINFSRHQKMKLKMFENKEKALEWLLSFH